MGNRAVDLTGYVFGRLVVVKCVGNSKDNHKLWLCKCKCGNEVNVASNSLIQGRTKSCGCIALEHTINIGKKSATHHKRNTRLYTIWSNMKQRCMNKKHTRYKDYGKRNIKICNEWKNDFEAFYNWAINNGYNESLTLDRINNNGNYEPSNCRWTTYKEQRHNRRDSEKYNERSWLS